MLTCDRQVTLYDGSVVVVSHSTAQGFCCLSDLKQLPGSLTAQPFGTLIRVLMDSIMSSVLDKEVSRSLCRRLCGALARFMST